MKRAPIVLASTVAGLAVALGFQPHTPAAAHSAAAVTATTAGSASPTITTASSTTSTTVTSDVVPNQYGNVQLKVTVKAGKVTGIQALQVPQNDPKSAEINAYAVPQLTQSALSAQSADIDAVSGATYTSDSYRTALQSALDKAGLATSSSGS